jgi:hypothetical protein
MNETSTNQATTNPVGEFLNPKSMLTPGLAGAMTMAITNALCSSFALPRPLIALALSCLLGIVTVGVATMPLWQKAVFTLFNSLFIFAMAVGTSTLGAAQAGPPPQASLRLPASFVANTAHLREWGGQRPDGTIVKATGPARYLMEAGMRRLIPDEETFKAQGFKNNDIKLISDSELQSIPLGKPLPSRRFFGSWF